MFRRYPYWGWLTLSIVLWCICGIQFSAHHKATDPEKMTRTVNENLLSSEKSADNFINDSALVVTIFSDSISSKDAAYLEKLPFYIFGYDKDSLRFWNTNEVVATCNDSAQNSYRLFRITKGVFLQKCVHLASQKKLVILLPIVIIYPSENDYLKSHFAASEYIPAKTKIIDPDKLYDTRFPVKTLDDKTVFFLQFNAQDIQPYGPSALFIILVIAALLASVSWIQLATIYVTRNKRPFVGLLATLCIVAGIRALSYRYGLPFNLDSLPFFSPRLYASSRLLSSLGDLFINTLCVLWVTVFIGRHLNFKAFFTGIRSTFLRYVVAVALFLFLIAYVFAFTGIIRSLVLDSNISFDVNHFYSINIYTILGLLTITIILSLSCLVIYLANSVSHNLIANRWIRYAVVIIIGTCYILVYSKGYLAYVLLTWLLLFIALLDIKALSLVSDLFDPRMVFWAAFICGFGTAMLQYFNHIKERDARKAFVEQRVAPQRDNLAEYSFDNVAAKIESDKAIKAFFKKPTSAARKIIDEKIDGQYLNGPLNKYQSKIYLFDANKRGLFNKDTLDYGSLSDEISESSVTNSNSLFYRESILDRHYYLSYLAIVNDSTDNIIGHVFIDLDLKKATNETVYPELLQPSSAKINPNEAEYAYAVYVNDKLITQVNAHSFPVNLKNDTLHAQQYVFYNNSSTLWYKISDKRTIVIVHDHSLWLEVTTIFSYLFGIQALLLLIATVYQVYISYFINRGKGSKLARLTLRKRVHFSMLAVVLLSFVIIGFVTIFFFISEYKDSNNSKLESAMQVVKQSAQEYLKRRNAFSAEHTFDTVVHSTAFKYFITNLAANQKIDINIFDNDGTLDVTSQDDIYDKSVLARVIRPDAYHLLAVEGSSIVVQNEKVGGLSYLSCYEPLRDESGATLGYINVPFFSSEKDLNFQISNIVVTLVNLYAFIFLISSLITVLITRWLTGTLNIIITQFSRLNLQRNERIDWPYDDEIGLLVREYNKMVKKVEENAALLAQSERETAWREMARQVAHEIKNPLTPMKLNIQYLQQAVRNNQENVLELAEKVADSLVEQIDNLSYIASEFSNFAKMPEARPENIDLAALINKTCELYLNEQHLKVNIIQPGGPLLVLSDRSQLIRVFTNLLENAKQAIPENKEGRIEIILRSEENNALVIIKDNGEGISEEVSKKIFQPYFTTKSSGTGLGLAMTKKIIEFWNGQIWFETEEGNGTTFYIKIPLITPTPST